MLQQHTALMTIQMHTTKKEDHILGEEVQIQQPNHRWEE
jgi:hypothetical protein